MITVELARDLIGAGVLWEPAAGDRFVIDAELLTGEVFWISDLTVEVQTYRDQSACSASTAPPSGRWTFGDARPGAVATPRGPVARAAR